MKKIMTVDGNEACAYTSYFFTEVAGIYPITPSSPMAEHIDEWRNQGRKNLFGEPVEVLEMESEAGAAGMVHGSLQTGALTSTYTASQGLLLMIPNMYKMAGEMLPAVIHVAARSLSTHALSIFGDHQDIYATRMTGFALLASSSVQDATYLAAVAHLSAIKSSLPFLHFFDGFRTSHEYQKIEVLEPEDFAEIIDQEALTRFRKRALNPLHPVTKGTAQNEDIYFQVTEARNQDYQQLPDIVNEYMQWINQKTGSNYAPFQYYGKTDAKYVIVAMGSVCETIKEVIDGLEGSFGLIEVHLYRPFSLSYFRKVLPDSVVKIAVLDRTKEAGSTGEPLYLDVLSVVPKHIPIIHGRYGLASKNTPPACIQAVFEELAKESSKVEFTIGIEDDVTHLSLPILPHLKTSQADEVLVYGYGSDGMVSACKSIISLVGNHTNRYVQGYFQYDSKKSGGVTVSHLRFADSRIRSAYFVSNPSLVVLTKDSYLEQFEILSNINENGIFLLNTIQTEAEVKQNLPQSVKNILMERHISFYTINAYEIARKAGLNNKISMIMENVILYLSQIMDYEVANAKLKTYIQNHFAKKGIEVVNANLSAMEESILQLKKIEFDFPVKAIAKVESHSVWEAMKSRSGDLLPVSSFLNMRDGTFEAGTSAFEKRGISDLVPSWINQNCIMCNQCAFVCPHSVIRPFLLDEQEYQKAPATIQQRCLKPIEKGLQDYYYCIGISVLDCTGCGLCIQTCPGKRQEKALITKTLIEARKEEEQSVFDYLNQNVAEKKFMSRETVKGVQFFKPKLCYHGACAGCGEPNYIKLLTQLYGDSLVIANATGCSSIYGGSAPSMPYTIPWASSLFEDNAEYGYGMVIANHTIRTHIAHLMETYQDQYSSMKRWLAAPLDVTITREVYEELKDQSLPEPFQAYQEMIPNRIIWMVGGDGWAYDIGFNGIDHVLASSHNVNILVLDSQVYSNTGGQSSKASPKGSIASFAYSGKVQAKKDLARIALTYPHVYVAQISLGANLLNTLKVLQEATEYDGPSIVIAYSPCISHGIKGGMENSLLEQKLAVQCGYFPMFHYNPKTNIFQMDQKTVDFDLYESFLQRENRYRMLKQINPKEADLLLKENKENAMKRYAYYESLTTIRK